MNNHTYRDYFDIDEGYFPCVNESAIHSGFEWKNTYPHQTFIDMLEKMERVLARQEKRSLWIEGAYGTGKSQCAYAMKKILEVSEEELRAYWNKYEPLKKKHDLLEKIVGHTQKGIITAHRYASGSIHSPRDMFLAIQDSVKTALVKAKLNTGENTLKESVIAWLEDADHKGFLDNLLKNPEKEWKAVFSQSSAEEVLSQLRKSGQVESLMNNLFRLADKEGITALNINADRLIAWIKDIIDSNDIKIVLIWDEFSDYFKNNRKDPMQSIYKLTDQTNIEREEVIAWISKNYPIPQLKDIYPALATYLKQYVFRCGELSSLLTEYFNDYKRQKLSGKLEDDFLVRVDDIALTRPYNRYLPTRNVVFDSLEKEGTYLLWLDALGVEYLAYIADLVHKRGLSIQIYIARAELPTITQMNRDFFDDWTGKKEKNHTLDETKHKHTGGDKAADKESPVHLATELEIIAAVIEKAATKLTSRKYKRFIIASDHGSSRLAVLRRKDEQYPTDTQGEHSGRCCKKFEPYDLPFATEENGYLVLADYGRFKGSRAAIVEVHGGASLEEVVVPIIALTLKNENIKVELVDDSVIADSRTGIVVTLFANARLTNVSLAIKDERYIALPTDENHFKIEIPDIRRAGEYQADVYTGDDLIGKILIKARGKSGKVNEGFDELF